MPYPFMAEVVFLPRWLNNNDFLIRVTSFCRNNQQKVANSVNFKRNKNGYKIRGLTQFCVELCVVSLMFDL